MLFRSYFSFSSGMVHRYYLAMISPAIAGLIGIGITVLLKKCSKSKMIFIFGVTAVIQLYIQSLYEGWLNWLFPLCVIIFIFAGILIFFGIKSKAQNQIIALSIIALLILPCIWSFTLIMYGDNSQIPITGPELKSNGDLFDQHKDLSKLITYLKENKGDAEYIVSVPSAINMGSELILQSGEPVMILGGFNGGDNPLNLDEYKYMISTGKIKYAIITDNKASGTINDWIIENCTPISEQSDGFTLYKLSLD